MRKLPGWERRATAFDVIARRQQKTGFATRSHASDAESRGDQNAAWFFRQSQQQLAQMARQARQLLADRLQGEAGGAVGARAGAMGSGEVPRSETMGLAGNKSDVVESSAAAAGSAGAGTAEDVAANQDNIGLA